MMNKKMFRFISLSWLMLVTVACVHVGPDYEKPTLEVVEAAKTQGFVNLPTSTVQADAGVWQSVEDEDLKYLLALALEYNQDIEIATANLLSVLTTDQDAWLDRLPQPLTTAEFSERQDSENKPFPAEKGGESYQSHNVSQNFTLELDWLGRVGRLNQSTSAQVEASTHDLAHIRLLTLAHVTRAYVLLRGTQMQLQSTKANAAQQKETWQLTQSRLDAGVATPIDVARAKSQYYATLASVAPLEAAQKNAAHRLGVLTGVGSGKIGLKFSMNRPIPNLPDIHSSLISVEKMLAARPDVLAAEAGIKKAVAEIGMAQALYYPQISLIGDIGYESENVNNLNQGSSVFTFLGVSIRWAGLGFKRVKVLTNRARMQARAAHAFYKKTVLQALEEVENALVAYQSSQAVAESLGQSAEAAERAAQLAQQRYEGGVIGFLEVLDAQRTQLEIENQLANAKTEEAQAKVDLYLSLALD